VTLSLDRGEVLVRMYNVGFGDCFLIAFPADDRPRKVLVDCGSHSAGSGPVPISEVAARVVEDVTDDDGVPRIDVVVGTHRHQDHVSGFRADVWDDVQVTEVWMPWTEHPTDPQARRIRETQSQVARHLWTALQGAEDERGTRELAENALTNAEAMTTLHKGFAGSPRRRFLPSKDAGENSFPVDSLPGVTVHAMGPSRDPEVIRDMDPPVGGGYLRMVRDQEASGDQEPSGPFSPEWKIAPADFLAENRHLRLTDKERRFLDDLAGVDFFQIAVALDRAVNGTSLMLMFELRDAVLLFPGDAQWGTWQAALANETWRPLLERTAFYKVAHHGSHNATPRAFVEDALGKRGDPAGAPLDDFRAAVSTRTMKRWKFIPKQELMEALAKTSPRVVRSDVRDQPVPDFDFVDELVVETRIPIRR
jgi:beta-lactamase superfamily II metal-dependent hydrolase